VKTRKRDAARVESASTGYQRRRMWWKKKEHYKGVEVDDAVVDAVKRYRKVRKGRGKARNHQLVHKSAGSENLKRVNYPALTHGASQFTDFF